MNRIIRKPIDADCLLEGDLHPSVRLRLERVRELPVKGVANLHGVERAGHDVFALWERIEGRTLEDAAATAGTEQIARVLRETELIVSGMHGAGIVHGAVHERNIIIDDAGGVKLTHVSPLLFEDEQIDRDALEDLRSRFGAGAT
jgi:tRNA A-37 threonylcarbamoyl transferase component Bud32